MEVGGRGDLNLWEGVANTAVGILAVRVGIATGSATGVWGGTGAVGIAETVGPVEVRPAVGADGIRKGSPHARPTGLRDLIGLRALAGLLDLPWLAKLATGIGTDGTDGTGGIRYKGTVGTADNGDNGTPPETGGLWRLGVVEGVVATSLKGLLPTVR